MAKNGLKARVGLVLLAFSAVLTGCPDKAGSGQAVAEANQANARGGATDALSLQARLSNARTATTDAVAGGADSAGSQPSTLAGLPDRGELAQPAVMLRARREGAYTWFPVRVSEAHALASIGTGRMKLRTPAGELLELAYDRHEEHASGDWSWIGHVEGMPAGLGDVLITFGAHAVFGTIAQPDRRLPPLKITTSNGVAWLGNTTYAALKQGAPRFSAPDYLVPDPAELQRARKDRQDRQASAPQADMLLAVKPTIDLIMGYTGGMVSLYGSHSAVVTRLNHVIDVTNNALTNSQINGRIRLLHVVAVAYPNLGDSGVALESLAGVNGRAVPASLQALHGPLREQFGADLVSLVRPYADGHNSCGIAYLNGAGQGPITPASAIYGFSHLSDNNGCSELVAAHELGHNFGQTHDVANAGGGTGAHAYSYGYKTTQPDGVGFADIMAYEDAGQVKVYGYSNPNLSFMGVPFGTAEADVARSANQTFPLIAQFRATKIFNGVRARNDVSGDAKSDIILVNPGSRVSSHWRMDGYNVVATPPVKAFGSGDQLAATGDFNGDGRTDMIWLTPARRVVLWQSNGSAWTAYPLATAALDASWSIVGAADISGNGKAKLLFVNATTHRFTFWNINGTRVTYNDSIAINAGDRLVATGDFNGDGQHDLVWKNSAGTVTVWWTNTYPINLARTQAGSTGGALGWHVIAAGDVNGDGRADLMFFHPGSRNFVYWEMSGRGYERSGPSVTLAPGWKFATSGDFNGDGRVDLVWRNGTVLSMWSSNGSLPGAQHGVGSGLSTSWQVIKGGVGGN